jgi:hypothetical protein
MDGQAARKDGLFAGATAGLLGGMPVFICFY